MSKSNVLRIVITVILVLLIVASVGFFVADIMIAGTPPTENLFKMLAAVFICIGSLVRLYARGGARGGSLEFYASQYKDILGDAFADSPADRVKLLRAVKLYNLEDYGRASKILLDMMSLCKTKDDIYAVRLFLALTFTDMGLVNEAENEYRQLIDAGLATSMLYSNLGHLYSALGRQDDAVANLLLAIQNDSSNPYPYQNLAKLYFDSFDFEKAKEYAHSALAVDQKFRLSASLLALIYSLEEDKVNAEKYRHISISCGEDPVKLDKAIAHYKSTFAESEEQTDDD